MSVWLYHDVNSETTHLDLGVGGSGAGLLLQAGDAPPVGVYGIQVDCGCHHLHIAQAELLALQPSIIRKGGRRDVLTLYAKSMYSQAWAVGEVMVLLVPA